MRYFFHVHLCLCVNRSVALIACWFENVMRCKEFKKETAFINFQSLIIAFFVKKQYE